MAPQAPPHQDQCGFTNDSENLMDFLQAIGDDIFNDLPSYAELNISPPDYEPVNDPSASLVLPFHSAFSQPQEASAVLNPMPWWETEARTILQGRNFESIHQILQFQLYGHRNSLRHILQHRSEYVLDQILVRLRTTGAKDGPRATAELRRDQKVEEILDLVKAARPLSPMSWRWAPYKVTDETDTDKIAADIAEESCALFRKVSFRDWLRHSIGYEEESVDELFLLHGYLSCCLRSYLDRHPNETDKYAKVEKKLRNQSPLAHQALSYCLAPRPDRMPLPRLPFDLDIITGPLRRSFEARTLRETVIRLPMLASRFDLKYNSVLDDINWTSVFKTDLDIFETLMADISMKQLAREATISDKYDLDLLCPAGLKRRDPHLIHLNNKSNEITMELAECCIAHPPLMHCLRELVEELFRLRNWYRFSAILLALRRAHFDESTSSSYFDLINPNSNYAAFRAHMTAQPGLPFLFPYLQQYAFYGEAGLSGVYSFVTYNIEAVLAESNSSARKFGFLHYFLACIYH